MNENVKLKVVVIENEGLKQMVAILHVVVIANEGLEQMVAKLEDEIQACKETKLETNELLNKFELKEALQEEKMDIMSQDVSEMKNVCRTKS